MERAPIRIAPVRTAPRTVGRAPRGERSIGSTPTLGRFGLEGFSSRILNPNFQGAPVTPAISRMSRFSQGTTLRAMIPARPQAGQGVTERLRPFEPASAQRRADSLARRNLSGPTGPTRSAEVTNTEPAVPHTVSRPRQMGTLRRFDIYRDGARTNLLRRTEGNVTIVHPIGNPRPPDYAQTAHPVETGLAPVINLAERRRERVAAPQPRSETATDNVIQLNSVRSRLARLARERELSGQSAPVIRPEASQNAVVTPLRRVRTEALSPSAQYKTELLILAERRKKQGRQMQDEIEKTYFTEKQRVEDQWWGRTEGVKDSKPGVNPFATKDEAAARFLGTNVRQFLGKQRVPYHVRVLESVATLKGQTYEMDAETKALIAEEEAKRRAKPSPYSTKSGLRSAARPDNEHSGEAVLEALRIKFEDLGMSGFVKSIDKILNRKKAVTIDASADEDEEKKKARRMLLQRVRTRVLGREKNLDTKPEVGSLLKTDIAVSAITEEQQSSAAHSHHLPAADMATDQMASPATDTNQNREVDHEPVQGDIFVRDNEATQVRLEQIDGGISIAETMPDGRVTGEAVAAAAEKFTPHSKSKILHLVKDTIDGSEVETWDDVRALPALPRHRMREEAHKIVAFKPPVDRGKIYPVNKKDVDRVFSSEKIAA